MIDLLRQRLQQVSATNAVQEEQALKEMLQEVTLYGRSISVNRTLEYQRYPNTTMNNRRRERGETEGARRATGVSPRARRRWTVVCRKTCTLPTLFDLV